MRRPTWRAAGDVPTEFGDDVWFWISIRWPSGRRSQKPVNLLNANTHLIYDDTPGCRYSQRQLIVPRPPAEH